MGKRVSFSVEARSAASPAAIYALLSDGATWPTWSPFQAFELEREGEAGGESKGAIRVLATGRVRSLSSRGAARPTRPGNAHRPRRRQ
jgi:Polyketide cyclase / dehydrase and lipid transport